MESLYSQGIVTTVVSATAAAPPPPTPDRASTTRVHNQRRTTRPVAGFCNRHRHGHLLGYARVSTTDQQPHLQDDALTAAGCYRVVTENASGARTDRPTLEQLHPGDALVVWRLDRLGRSLRHQVDTIARLAERGIGFRSLQETIDPTCPAASRHRPRSARRLSACLLPPDGHTVRSDRDEGAFRCPGTC
jgi:hypothetical protein